MAATKRPRSLIARLRELAETSPDHRSLICTGGRAGTESVSTAQLVDDILDMAEGLGQAASDGNQSFVLCHPAGVDRHTATLVLAALCAEVTLVLHPPGLPADVLDGALAQGGIGPATEHGPGSLAPWRDRPYERRPTYFLLTSGTTGAPKLTPFWNYADYDPRGIPDVLFRATGWSGATTHLLTLPVYHIAPFGVLVQSVLDGHTLLLGQDLDPAGTLEVIAEYGADWLLLTPHDMGELLPATERHRESLRGVRTLLHTALPCPPGLKRAWIDLLGPDRVYETYGGTEGVGMTFLRGREWIEHPGSIGRGLLTRIRIVGEDGTERVAGDRGTVYMRRLGAGSGTTAGRPWLDRTADGFASLGDVGFVDEDGYLYLHDRLAHRIDTGEGPAWLGLTAAVLREHPDLSDAECVDDGSGRGLLALVVSRGEDDDGRLHRRLTEFCAARLTPPERPSGYVRVPAIPRSALGKADRAAIARLAASRAPICDSSDGFLNKAPTDRKG